jgi:hypothetical protein
MGEIYRMTIEYKDSKRISALSSDVVNTPTYEDDFSTDTLGANTTDATYIDWDGSGAIDLIAPVSVATGGGDSGWFDLTTVSDSVNVVRFSLDTSAITVGITPQMWIGLSSIGTGDSTTTNDWFGMYMQASAGNPIIIAGHVNANGCNNASSDNTFTKTLAVEKIWVEIIRTSTTAFTLNIFSDEYVTLTESKTGVTTSVTSTTNFRMITRNSSGTASGWTLKLGDLKFYNGVSSLTNKPTNVQDNSILVEKDTGRRYWFDEGALIYEDDFTSYANTTEGDTAYPTTNTTDMRVNITNDYLDFNSKGASGSEHIYYATDLNASDDKWVLRFKQTTSAKTLCTSNDGLFTSFGLSSTTTAPTNAHDFIGVMAYLTDTAGNWYTSYSDGGTENGLNTALGGEDPEVLQTRYVQITRTSTISFNVTMWTGGFDQTEIHNTTQAIPATVSGLKYLHFDSDIRNGNSGEFIMQIDDVEFYNGVTTPTPATWECSNFGKSLTNLHAWYDASDLSSVTKDSSNRVSQFNDKSGNGRHLSQATSGSQPLWVSEGQNGKDLIDCAGSRFMKTGTWTAVSQPYTFFFVAKLPDNTGADKAILDSISNTSLIYKQTTADRFLMYAGSNAGATMAGYANTWRYVTVIFDGTNLTYRFDGVHKNTEGSTVGTGTSNGLLMGARDGSTFSNSKFGEIIMIAGNPTAQEITDTEAYLKAKWGL